MCTIILLPRRENRLHYWEGCVLRLFCVRRAASGVARAFCVVFYLLIRLVDRLVTSIFQEGRGSIHLGWALVLVCRKEYPGPRTTHQPRNTTAHPCTPQTRTFYGRAPFHCSLCIALIVYMQGEVTDPMRSQLHYEVDCRMQKRENDWSNERTNEACLSLLQQRSRSILCSPGATLFGVVGIPHSTSCCVGDGTAPGLYYLVSN